MAINSQFSYLKHLVIEAPCLVTMSAITEVKVKVEWGKHVWTHDMTPIL